MKRTASSAAALAVLAALICGLPLPARVAVAAPAADPEVGHVPPGADGADLDLPGPHFNASRLELGCDYTHFTGEGMQDPYGGLPGLTAGVSALVGRNVRSVLTLGYLLRHGNSLDGVPGLSGPDDMTLRVVPVRVGLRVQSEGPTRTRFNVGLAFVAAWVQETLPALDGAGRVVDTSDSDLLAGYDLTFGPEFALGDAGTRLGLEVGWGGVKGDLGRRDASHTIDLTGWRGRVFCALEL